MNQSLSETDKVLIKMKIKLFSSSKIDKILYRNELNEGHLVLSIYDKGHKMVLSLVLLSDKDTFDNEEIVLSNWSSTKDTEGRFLSVMDNQWHHIDITLHRHKSFTLTVNNRSQREEVIKYRT